MAMKHLGKIGSLVACALLLSGALGAQDLHFSQFFNSPLTTNPANTGFIPDANYRVGINYRSQWTSVPAPYTTSGSPVRSARWVSIRAKPRSTYPVPAVPDGVESADSAASTASSPFATALSRSRASSRSTR